MVIVYSVSVKYEHFHFQSIVCCSLVPRSNLMFLQQTMNNTNMLNPIVHFWLHVYHTAHCAEKIVSARLRAGSASAERVGQGEVGGVIHRVLCTWWLLGLALKRPWLVPGGPPHILTAWTGLENTCRGLVSGKKGCLVSEQVYGNQ